MTAPPRRTLDVSELPEVVFGPKDTTWWGTVGFMVIEGTTLAVCCASYLYLRKNVPALPQQRVPLPSQVVPTLNVQMLLLEMCQKRRVEFAALNVRWDQNAYGSAAWATLGFHATLLLVDTLETAAIAAIFHFAPLEEKHFTDASDAAFYQYFLSLVYVPLYVLLFLAPRWI